MEKVNEQAGTYSEEKFDVVRAQNLPLATIISDNDMLLVVQGGYLKRALPSAMKGKKGDAGLSAYLGVTATYIVWRQGASGVWQNLLEIEKLRGPKGEKPIFEKRNGCLMMKYEGQPDSAFVNIFDREELKMKFSDLTPAEVNLLKLHFSDLTAEDIKALQQPATEAAAEVREEMVQISEDVNQTLEKLVEDAGKVNTDLTASVGALEERAETVISETNKVKEAAEEAVINADNATAAANGAAGLANTAAKDTNKATELAVVAAKLAGEKAEKASTSADKADTAAGAADDAAALANEKATLANNAAEVADTATGKANTAIGNAETATKRANDAAAAAENIVSGIRPDWAVDDPTSENYIANKPDIPDWALEPEAPDGFPEAPKDNKTYGRKDGLWSEVNSAGNMDGGTAYSVYGGSLVMDGGNVND